MSAIRRKKIFKVVAMVTFVIALVLGIIYLVMAKKEGIVKNVGGYVVSYEEVNGKYEAKVIFNKGASSEFEKTYTYDSEPKVGDTEVLYYLESDADNYFDEEPSLYAVYAWIGIPAAIFLVVSIVSYFIMRSIKPRRNAKVPKNIKVDEKSIIKKN